MIDKEKVVIAIFNAVDNLNLQLPKNERLEKSNETVLIGENGTLDSLGLVNFLVAVEQEIEEQFKTTIMLFDDSLLSSESNPMYTIGSLADYVTNHLRSS